MPMLKNSNATFSLIFKHCEAAKCHVESPQIFKCESIHHVHMIFCCKGEALERDHFLYGHIDKSEKLAM